MPLNLAVPDLDEVRRIANVADAVVRNLQITQCYHELSTVLASRTGMSANWCTFATWASRQAGQTIRKEDLARLLQYRLSRSPSALSATEQIAAAGSGLQDADASPQSPAAVPERTYTPAIERASEAVARGNKKVFEEIGYEFARFYQTCLADQTPDPENVARFCQELRPGDPPDGQGYLRQAFGHYYQALFEDSGKVRSELILLANIEIGFHEQTRLQPEIAESLDAAFISSLEFTRLLLAGLFPLGGWLQLAHLYVRRLLGRPTALDIASRVLLAAARSHLRQLITEAMMTIALPSGARLRLGEDLGASFPTSLQQLSNPELRKLLEKHDPTPDSLLRSGAIDWADLPDRLHFIIDLFRCYQETEELLGPPFTPEQVQDLKQGKRPPGAL